MILHIYVILNNEVKIMALYTYKTQGTCSKEIHFEVEDGIIKSVKFLGGCPGNTLGVATLCIGRTVEEVIKMLEGIKCGPRPTSCPDQISKALKQAL